jgi:hypothetical protein
VSRAARLPDPPSVADLRATGIRDDEIRIVGTEELWWRVHRTQGRHMLAWNTFRRYGPILRFDPHPPPAREHADGGVWYGASTPDAALAESFQSDRTVRCHRTFQCDRQHFSRHFSSACGRFSETRRLGGV